MIPIPNVAQFEALYYYASPENEQMFYYLPATPLPETDLNGEPTAMLWLLSDTSRLQIGVRLSAEDAQLEALRQELATRQNTEPALIQLSPAPVSVRQVMLVLMENGDRTLTKTGASSGYPPYSAVFQVALTDAQAAQVSAAFGGRQDSLLITYELLFSTESQVESRLQGDLLEAITALRKATIDDVPSLLDRVVPWRQTSDKASAVTIAECLRQIDCAIAQKRLVLTRVETGDISLELRERTDNLVKEQAAHLLLQLVQRSPDEAIAAEESTIDIVARASEPAEQVIELTTDVGSWFSGQLRLAHIQRSPDVSAPDDDSGMEPATSESEFKEDGEAVVEAEFELPVDAIAFVQLSLDGEQGTLRPPEFAPAVLSVAGEESSLTIKTHYSDGGSPYETTLPAQLDQRWKIVSADCGLHLIRVDGTALQAAGIQKARIRVQYQPAEDGTADDQTLYFRHDDWQKNWYVVTRSPHLAGTLIVDAKMTKADGSIEHPAEQRFEHADLKLQVL